MRISDWSSDVCSSDLLEHRRQQREHREDQHAEKEAEERSDQEIAILEQREIDEGVLRGQRVVDEQVEKEHRERAYRSEEHTSELPSLMRESYDVYYMHQKTQDDEHSKSTLASHHDYLHHSYHMVIV